MKEIVYLAIPYTWNPELSFEIANEISAEIMQKGVAVFSPISHSHSISKHMPEQLKCSYPFWMLMDLPILEKCDSMTLVVIGEDGHKLIRDSKGCQSEIALCKDMGKNIMYYKYKLSEEQLKRI